MQSPPEGVGSHALCGSPREQSVHKLFFCVGDLARSPHLLLSAIIYLGQYGLVGICFIRWVIIRYSCVGFLVSATRSSAQLISSLGHWELFLLVPCGPPILFSAFLQNFLMWQDAPGSS